MLALPPTTRSPGKPLQTDLLDRAVASRGPAVNTGDSVQITKLEFRDHQNRCRTSRPTN